MLRYVLLPLHRVQLGNVLPVDVWSPDGRLLLRRGQVLQSEAHRNMLAAHQASMTDTDAQAWQKSLERNMRSMRRAGADMAVIARAPMPAEILDTDYLEGRDVDGGWLDLQEILRGLLYQGQEAINPLPRLDGLEQKALALMKHDPDECLFVLFQALPDLSLGYCATHALLAGALSAFTADKLALPPGVRPVLLRSAMVMNIGMARPQDSLARQHTPPSQAQRHVIDAHAPTSVEILRGFGINDEEMLDMVHWHHAPDASQGHADYLTSLRLLSLADSLIAKMAPRKTRPAMLPLGATKALMLQTSAETVTLRPAMAVVLGFYPPGTYVQLVNGEIAVVIKRGARPTSPHVASIMSTSGMPLSKYIYRDTRDTAFAVRAPIASNSVNIKISLEKVRRLRQHHEV
jgi:hypothetical protein